LYIAGIGVARGYRGRPELTAERFIPNLFSQEGGERLYRTGDVCRYLPDGKIEFIGRADSQVKIRGYRIELGEIEAALDEHWSVKQSVVVASEDNRGEKRLLGYVVGEQATPAELQKYLKERLPEYMAPSAIMVLEKMPLTPNGKLDRRALPTPDSAAGNAREYEAPVGETESALARLWAELLKVERVGRHDNFFELGGHSLLAVSLIERMRQEGLYSDVRTLFVTPTLNEFAAATEEMEVVL
jgi:aryl carrier-like protein